MHFRSPLSHARGLGSAKEGSHHWWVQRLTAIALVPLVIWFAASMVWVARGDYETVVAWIGNPFNAAMLVLFLFTSFYHAILGLQVIIEDYVHVEGAKVVALIAMKLVLALLGVVSVLAVLRIFVSGG